MKQPAEILDLYPSEKNAVKSIVNYMGQKHSFKGVKTVDQEDAIKRVFSLEVKNRLAEIGLVATVEWFWQDEETGKQSPDVNDDPEDMSLFWNPRVVIIGRTDTLEEIDHDRMQSEIVRGLDDGKAGYIRDGKLVDDPRKKDIY